MIENKNTDEEPKDNLLERTRCGYEDIKDNFPKSKKLGYQYCPNCKSSNLEEVKEDIL